VSGYILVFLFNGASGHEWDANISKERKKENPIKGMI
jgi:hypothetical protein